MEAYPMRLRERIIALYEEGNQTHEIAEMLGTCRSGTRRIKQILRERNSLEPRHGKRGPKSGLSEERSRQLRELVAADPDATREELRDRLQINVDVRTIGRWLTKLGLVLKKSRCVPPSRIDPTCKRSVAAGTSNSRGSIRIVWSSSTNPAPRPT
jgi:transposase